MRQDSNVSSVDVPEAMFFDRVLTDDELRGVEEYLDFRYFNPIPEPSTLLLALMAALGGCCWRRRRMDR